MSLTEGYFGIPDPDGNIVKKVARTPDFLDLTTAEAPEGFLPSVDYHPVSVDVDGKPIAEGIVFQAPRRKSTE